MSFASRGQILSTVPFRREDDKHPGGIEFCWHHVDLFLSSEGHHEVSISSALGDYGFDNPSGIFALSGVVLVFWALALVCASPSRWLPAIIGGFLSVFPLATLVGYVYSTRRGKLLVWAELLDGRHFRGEEQVLDMGCGRGAV